MQHFGQGHDKVDFGFKIDDRFLQLTLQSNTGCQISSNCTGFSAGILFNDGTTPTLETTNTFDSRDGTYSDIPFFILVY
ncbi:MAG: hypothetical protein NVS1B11_25910 [Terriglobales bacterium]